MGKSEKDEVLTAEEAAEYLRMALSTLYRTMREGKIPCFKVGNRWRFKRSVLNQWMERMSEVDLGWKVGSLDEEATMNKRDEQDKAHVNVGLGGIFKGLGSLLEFVEELAEKAPVEIKREGRIGSIPKKDFRAVYGFSVRVGGQGRPIVEQFGNVREEAGKGPVVDEVREPMVDTFDEGDFFLVVAEMPGVNEPDIKYEIAGDILTLSARTGERQYYKEVLLACPVDDHAQSLSYKNGVLEIKLWKTRKE